MEKKETKAHMRRLETDTRRSINKERERESFVKHKVFNSCMQHAGFNPKKKKNNSQTLFIFLLKIQRKKTKVPT